MRATGDATNCRSLVLLAVLIGSGWMRAQCLSRSRCRPDCPTVCDDVPCACRGKVYVFLHIGLRPARHRPRRRFARRAHPGRVHEDLQRPVLPRRTSSPARCSGCPAEDRTPNSFSSASRSGRSPRCRWPSRSASQRMPIALLGVGRSLLVVVGADEEAGQRSADLCMSTASAARWSPRRRPARTSRFRLSFPPTSRRIRSRPKPWLGPSHELPGNRPAATTDCAGPTADDETPTPRPVARAETRANAWDFLKPIAKLARPIDERRHRGSSREGERTVRYARDPHLRKSRNPRRLLPFRTHHG